MNNNTEKLLSEHLFYQREVEFERCSFDREIAFYESICSGNIEQVKLFSTPLCSEGCGILSKDKLRNLKYHFTVSAALIARFCIKSGMKVETAYNLSDIYIMRADECSTPQEVHAVHQEMIEEYTRTMRRIKNDKVYSKQILKTIDYISDHLHSKLRIDTIAEKLGLSSSYLSRLFKAETGMLFNDYVNSQKIEAATNLIRFSGYSDLEISNIMSFSSQSYFIKVFRKYTSMTPKEYRRSYNVPEMFISQ